MVDSMSESWNPLVLEQVMMCLVPSIEDTVWDFDMGSQWTLHVSMEILCDYVISFRMDRNNLICIQKKAVSILYYLFGYIWVWIPKLQSRQSEKLLILIAKMILCNNLCFSALLHPVTVKSRRRFTINLNLSCSGFQEETLHSTVVACIEIKILQQINGKHKKTHLLKINDAVL